MQIFKNKGIGLVAAGLGAGLTLTSIQACDPTDSPLDPTAVCGPCGSLAEGQVSFSADARLDGFFSAVADLGNVFGTVKADFEANIRGLAEAWGYAELGATIDADAVAGLIGHIEGEISANVEGGITLNYAPPRCQANVNVAVDARAQCEAQAGCSAQAEPPTVECEGSCSGSCSGECSAELACEASPGGIECSGRCEGACELELAARCDGICRGTCEGSAGTQEGFEGRCEGECQGSCEVSAGAECGGTCHGTCVVDDPSFACDGGLSCRGKCEGSCEGSCSATPGSVRAECEASAECSAQASAKAEANFECTPPSLEFAFAFRGELDASAQAEFAAKITALRVRGAAIVQGLFRLRGLINGDVNGDGSLEFDPPPIVNISGQIQGLISAGFEGDFDIPVGRLPCVLPAFQEAGSILTDVGREAGGTISAQARFFTGLQAIAG